MELRDFAGRVLFGAALEDKLFRPGPLRDVLSGGAVSIPDLPARVPELAPRPRLRPPPRNLEGEAARGELLHFFANHELLALEIMALVLLRFPQAPRSFRMGLATVMQEEQKHLALYLNRMRDFGVSFGEYELNDFFWRRLHDVAGPLDFSVRMSLTFEQANLDFAHFYRGAFRECGDNGTAAILDEVLRDEITHVRRGLSFFERHRPGRASAWREYLDLLPPDLDACRARGNVFALEPRRAAGLPDDFIDALRKHRRSKGRPPTVFLFDPFIESDLRRAGPAARTIGQLRLASELATAMVLFARHEDVVLCNRAPSEKYLARLATVDFPIPEFARLRELTAAPRKLSDVRPWGWTSRLEQKLNGLLNCVVGQTGVALPLQLAVTRPQRAWACAKDTAQAWQNEFGEVIAGGSACASRTAAVQALSRIHECGRTALVRPLLGAAGQGQRRLPPGAVVGRLTYPVLVETLEDRRADFSTHIDILEETVRVIGWTRQLVAPDGRYVGSVVGRFFDLDQLSLFSADGPGPAHSALASVRERLAAAAIAVGERLRARGFRGPVGIDAFLYRDQKTGRNTLRSIVDVNVRFTMGRLALEAARRMQSGRSGLLLQLRRAAVRNSGQKPFAELCDRVPPEIVSSPANLIARGILPLTDVYRAQRHAVVFCVGKTPGDCLAQLDAELSPKSAVRNLLRGSA